jgi:hypothetical protein
MCIPQRGAKRKAQLGRGCGAAMVDSRLTVPLAKPMGVPLSREPVPGPRSATHAGTATADNSATADSQSMASDLPDGCYRLVHRPATGDGVLLGTLRVDRTSDGLVVSGDLYHFADDPDRKPENSSARSATDIPVYPRDRYHCYLSAIGASSSPVASAGRLGPLSIHFERYAYHPPAEDSFNGTFAAAADSPPVTLRLVAGGAPGGHYAGDWWDGQVLTGTVELTWVSPRFRRCGIEVDAASGAVAPRAVPALDGTGMEDLSTILGSAGWAATVTYDQADVEIPADVADPSQCWSDAQLHALMTRNRRTTTDLDVEWVLHVLVVPGRITCSRGKMYDMVEAPREGVVLYSEDGFPRLHSHSFGTAEGLSQRQVPRAFLRSAGHEILHGFNQIHPEHESRADNSVMTTTPDVAELLSGATSTGTGGFPDDIKLSVNAQVRHRLIHLPDPVVRPGGHTFSSWIDSATSPADLDRAPAGIEVVVTPARDDVVPGEPLPLSWSVTNRSEVPVPVPDPVSRESTYALVTVVSADGQRRPMPPLVVECDNSRISDLAPQVSRSAGALLYWSTNGFAFDQPGRYLIEVRLQWAIDGRRVVAVGEASVRLSRPDCDRDRDAAALLLHPQVGTWVALGGGASHLSGAVSRLDQLRSDNESGNESGAATALRGYGGLLSGDCAGAATIAE